MNITFKQTNSKNLTDAHEVKQMVISPLMAGGLLQEIPQTGSIREFLFEMRKDGEVYWIGAAVPEGTSDFSKAQVFFHPTVVQNGVVHAAEGDYPAFRGGWSGSLQRYIAMQGGQLAGARKTGTDCPVHDDGRAYRSRTRLYVCYEPHRDAERNHNGGPQCGSAERARLSYAFTGWGFELFLRNRRHASLHPELWQSPDCRNDRF
jgi:hypothetical protein